MAVPKAISVELEQVLEQRAGASAWDALIVVAPEFAELPESLTAAIEHAAQVDAQVTEQISVVGSEEVPGKRLVLAPTGPLDRDFDDVRRFYDAARLAGVRARDAGARRPVLVTLGAPDSEVYDQAAAAAYFGLAQGLYEPLEAREHFGDAELEPLTEVGVCGEVNTQWLTAVEAGRRLARDLAGTEPERMAPLRFAQYCQEAFAGTAVKVSLIDDRMELEHKYPLLSAVARASFDTRTQQPCVVRLEYEGQGPIDKSLFLVGKGITYDTGGADLKVGGGMAGMSRDKGGAAGVAGLLKAVAGLEPAGVKVTAELALVRNNIDAEAFVADEIITGYSGVRVRVGNTDAEGRLVMADCLAHLREEAVGSVNPQLYTVATLTGHAALSKGPYSALVPNGAARHTGVVDRLIQAGETWADPCELSPSRREDFDFVRGHTKADDLLSSNNGPSATTKRGHQFPMAFLTVVSKLDQHGVHSEQPIPYVHVDIAGSGVEGGDWQHGKPAAAPVLAMAANWFAPE